MDPISHAALGASTGWARRAGPSATLGLAAVMGALVPDLDLLWTSSTDPLLALERHREATHALLLAPVQGTLVALLLHMARRRTAENFTRLSVAATFGVASHALLDACTSYGTALWWPLSEQRVALGIVAVVDPLFTLPVLLLVWATWRRQRASYGIGALLWAGLYLALGALQQSRAAEAALELASARRHAPARLEVMPALGSVLLWKTIYEHAGRYYVDGVRAGVTLRCYTGESVPLLDVARDFPALPTTSQQARDVARFGRAARNLVVADPAHPTRVVELRYSMVPQEIAGFWAIEIDVDKPPSAHVELIATRATTPADARRLLTMIVTPGGSGCADDRGTER